MKDDKTLFAEMVGHIFGYKNPWPFAMMLMRDYFHGTNYTWGAWCLTMLNHRIIDPFEQKPITDKDHKVAFLITLTTLKKYSYRGLDFNSNHRVKDYYNMVMPSAKRTGMSTLGEGYRSFIQSEFKRLEGEV